MREQRVILKHGSNAATFRRNGMSGATHARAREVNFSRADGFKAANAAQYRCLAATTGTEQATYIAAFKPKGNVPHNRAVGIAMRNIHEFQ